MVVQNYLGRPYKVNEHDKAAFVDLMVFADEAWGGGNQKMVVSYCAKPLAALRLSCGAKKRTIPETRRYGDI